MSGGCEFSNPSYDYSYYEYDYHYDYDNAEEVGTINLEIVNYQIVPPKQKDATDHITT